MIRFVLEASPNRYPLFGALISGLFLVLVGCGTTKSFTATEQLLMSDAVDSTISKMDFRPLSGHKVFLDVTYVSAAGKVIPGVPLPANLVTSDYIISGLRQQMTAAGCMLVDSRDAAEIICEARCSALGTDGHSVIYGMPANNIFANASNVIPGSPQLPTIPEISVAKREMKSAAAKVSVFAYDRETREPIWQSGIAQAGSSTETPGSSGSVRSNMGPSTGGPDLQESGSSPSPMERSSLKQLSTPTGWITEVDSSLRTESLAKSPPANPFLRAHPRRPRR